MIPEKEQWDQRRMVGKERAQISGIGQAALKSADSISAGEVLPPTGPAREVELR